MDEAGKYEHAARIYAAHLEAADLARKNAGAARQALALADPGNPALKVPLKEYALLKAQPLLLLAEILFGGNREVPRQAITPELVLLAGTVAVGQGYSTERVITVVKRLIERERRGL
ncbi:hypothetical protein E308F_25950 [Moorella sp. E308F]|uniref:hypothetical protein n=1 Tax=Moorella sp. E308F TaxID=2572682 RepID=UPI0010FFB32A|nr:hypothetical protein [Moorella sp. E308F]MDK2895803.1 hypothetical protein [Moorella sp. (in: firmicutes)]GEA16349.1 hypothetical protein E308F_25950 [Moorella sp. E308F]